MKLISEPLDLQKLDEFLAGLSKEIAMGFGSIFRIPHQYLRNWGILVTDKNREWIKDQANDSYLAEWKAGTKKTNEAIERAIEAADLETGNERLNAQLGDMVVTLLKTMHDGKRTFKIYDIGAGAGDTTLAILDHLDLWPETRRIANYCFFRLIEPSEERLVIGEQKVVEGEIRREGSAKQSIENHRLYKLLPGPPAYIVGDHTYLDEIGDDKIDIVVSNAVFHHMPFPDHFETIRKKLRVGGVMAVGDWHTTLWKHPAFVVPVLEEALRADDSIVTEFKNRFNIKTGDRERLESEEITELQKEGHKYMIKWLRALVEELKKVGESLNFLEAHEAVEDRVQNINEEGKLETNLRKLRRRNHAFKEVEDNVRVVFKEHDLAAIITAGKLPAPKKRKQATRKRSRAVA